MTDNFVLEVLGCQSIPIGAQFGGVLPILEPYEDAALLRRDQETYPLFRNKIFSLKNGDAHLLRVDVLIANSEDPLVFELRLRIDYHDASNRCSSYSEPFYLAKFFGGHTNRNPYSDGDNTNNNWDEFSNSLRNDLKPDLYTTGTYAYFFSTNDHHKKLAKNHLAYLKAHLRDAVMAKSRTPVETYGFVKNNLPVQESELRCGNATSHRLQGSVRVFSYGDDVWIYEGRSDTEYKCVRSEAKEIAIRGSHQQRFEAVEFLIGVSIEPELDVAATVEIIRLLALFPIRDAFSRIADYLSSDNSLVQDTAAQMLTHTKFCNANRALLSIVRTNRFAKSSAFKALALCGDQAVAHEVYELFKKGAVAPDDIEAIKDVIFSTAPDFGRQCDFSVPTESMFDVFLSYNSNDRPTVRQLGLALKDRGLSVWL